MFGDPTNFWKEVLDFQVVDFPSPYHALLGRPCYVKFLVVPYYGCLKLKMLGPWGVIMAATSVAEAYHYEQEGTTLAMVNIATTDFAQIWCQLGEEPLNGMKGTPTAAFCPANDTKMI